MEGNFEQRPIAWVVEKWFWGQHEIHKNQSISLSKFSVSWRQTLNVHISSAILKYNTMGHWYVHTEPWVKSPLWLYHLQFSGLNAFWSAPELSASWLNWMSLPNKLKCSHTVITLRFKGNLICMNHKFVYVPCGVVRQETWHTTDSQNVCFTRPRHSRYIFFSFLLKMCSKPKVAMFSERLNASFVLVGAALTFLPIQKANCSEVDACS